MKSEQQLLELSRNPYYRFTEEEKKRLDSFLSKKQGKGSKRSQKKSSDESEKKTPVRVKNIVEKADTEPREVAGPLDSPQTTKGE